jgi:hypothetical protein
MATQPEQRSVIGAVFMAERLSGLPAEALSMVIEREATAAQLSFDVNATRLKNLRRVLTAGTGVVRFGDAVVEVSSKRVRIGSALAAASAIEPTVLNVPGVTRVGSYRVEISAEPRPGWAAIAEPEGVLRARSAGAGDRVRRADREVRLARLLADAGIPRWETRELLVVADGPRVVALPTLAVPTIEATEPGLWVRAVAIETI